MEMQELVRLIDNNDCPACGPQKLILATRVTDIYRPYEGRKVCTCCGRVYLLELDQGVRPAYQLSIESIPPIAGQEYPYTCAIDHPEHKWPVDYDNPVAEPKTEEEKNQVDGQTITESPYEIAISAEFLADMMKEGSAHNFRVIQGPSVDARVARLYVRGDGNGQEVVVEFDRPVPPVMLEDVRVF